MVPLELAYRAGLLTEEKARLIERERKEGNGAAMASPSQEAQKIDLQIGNHRLRENQLLDVPRAIVEARAALRGETMGFLLLGLYHVIALPLLAGAFSLSVGSESLPSLVSVLALAAVMGAFAPHLVWRATGGFSGPGTGSASR